MFPRLALTSASILLFATQAHGQFNVGPSVEYGMISNPSGMTSADFNGDGFLDLATTAEGADRVVWFQNAGDGTFAASFNALLPNSSSPQDLIAGDFDGDMDQDLAVALRDPAGTVQLMLNNGLGTFSLGGSFAVGSRPRGFSLADIDGDMDLDLAIANRDSDNMSVLTNNGSGSFSVMTVGVGAEPRDTAFGNFLADAGLEIAVTNQNDRTVTILDGGPGAYTPVMTLNIGAPLRPDGITMADLNGDGLTDLAVAASDPSFASIFINNGGVQRTDQLLDRWCEQLEYRGGRSKLRRPPGPGHFQHGFEQCVAAGEQRRRYICRWTGGGHGQRTL